MADTAEPTEPRRTGPHCATCTCGPEPLGITVYPPGETMYGRCERCRQARWVTHREKWSGADGYTHDTAWHCGCCTHPHDLRDGWHALGVDGKVPRG